ncbi:Transcription initiation factor TFIID subunit 10 [Pichia californica]|uniref:Transcription initiation factor TFIID subunit 10 n=1 Tax=Pichia californica TaxID=460514 RepID=A0A9P6WI30_9ASCO|nr:Transcription initiation factor TFIID subunit 10 [[Candida] californica]KAG0687520.1 Transcription initiation factor TFIID subunit 10 [[Candida] californica]
MSGIFSSNDIDELNEDANTADAMDVDIGDNNTSKPDVAINNNNNNNNNNKDKDKDTKDKESTESDIPFSMPNIPQLTRADKTLDELLDLLDDPDFTPIIPDAVTDYYIGKSGLDLNFVSSNNNSNSTANIEATKIKRLLALATQKFISDIATDAYEYSRIRSNSAVYSANNPQARSRALMLATMSRAKGGNTASGSNNDVTTSSNSNPNGTTTGGTNDDGTGTDDANMNGGNLNPTGASQNKEKTVLTIGDLSSALDEYGLNINRPQFYR